MITDLRTTPNQTHFRHFTSDVLNELKKLDEINTTLYKISINQYKKSDRDYTFWLFLITVLLGLNIIY